MELIEEKALAQAVRRFRLEVGYSQEAMGRAILCSRSAYSYKESGKARFSFTDLQRVADQLGVAPDVFFHPELFDQPLRLVRQLHR